MINYTEMENYSNDDFLNFQYVRDEDNVYDEITTLHHLTIRLDDLERADNDTSNNNYLSSEESTEEFEIIIKPKEKYNDRHQDYTYKEFNKKVS